jgi:hypothetical protein
MGKNLFFRFSVFLLMGFSLYACKKDSQDPSQTQGSTDPSKEGGTGGNCTSNNCGNQPGTLGIQATADLTDAFGLLVLDEEKGVSLALDSHNATVDRLDLPVAKISEEEKGFYLSATASEAPAAMQKIDKTTGEIVDALKQEKTDSTQVFDPNRKLPKLRTIAVSPTGEVYLHFENPFIYKDAKSTDDPWNMSNGFQCQIFKIKGGTLDQLMTTAPQKNNLECVDNLHFINNWGPTSNQVFQFDSLGALYYPGSLPNGGNKTVVYRQDRDGKNRKEMINANICVQNFLVTKTGGIFYTGNTCSEEGGGGGGQGGFFRYVAPGENGAIMEIARDWWNFIYDTSVTEAATDLAVFFGPDPRQASTASWNSACLFEFDPSQADPATRIQEVITCGNNIWDWMSMNRAVDITNFGQGYNQMNNSSTAPTLAWRQEYKRRCESKDEVFAGGGSQISAIKQDSAGEIYVIGNIRKKAEGNLLCSVNIRGPHCTVENNPVLLDQNGTAYTETTCQGDNGIWVNKGQCSNQSTDAASCINHSRQWNPGYCSNPDYTTQAACEAAAGCSSRWYADQTACTNAGFTWHDGTAGNGLVWRQGRCSTNEDLYETQAACEGASHTWNPDEWSGACSSAVEADNATLYNNNKNGCVPEWTTEQVWYNGAKGDICSGAETADRATFWDWNHKDNHFAQTASSTKSAYGDLTGKFLIQQMSCEKVASEGGNSGDWTTEYSALAQVDREKKTLKLLSLETEKAINLWLVGDKPYYSSFDAVLGQYTLNGLNETPRCQDPTKSSESLCVGDGFTWADRACLVPAQADQATCEAQGLAWKSLAPYTVMNNFEAYHLTESDRSGHLYADGLDFMDNQYKFGSIDLENKTLLLKDGLTGTLKTILILPQTAQ